MTDSLEKKKTGSKKDKVHREDVGFFMLTKWICPVMDSVFVSISNRGILKFFFVSSSSCCVILTPADVFPWAFAAILMVKCVVFARYGNSGRKVSTFDSLSASSGRLFLFCSTLGCMICWVCFFSLSTRVETVSLVNHRKTEGVHFWREWIRKSFRTVFEWKTRSWFVEACYSCRVGL